MSALREHLGLIVILAVFLALGMLYLRATPLLETPDEPSHFSVIKFIADQTRLPPAHPAPADAGPVPVIVEGPPVYYAPPLYYVLGAALIADLNTEGFAQAVIPNPNWARGWAPTPDRSSDNKHIYVLTDDQRPPLSGWAAAMERLRLLSLLLGAATVLGVYTLARAVWRSSTASEERPGDQSWVFAATALVALNPAFLFVTIGVSNDALLIALSTWAFVLMVRLVLSDRNTGAAHGSWGLVLLLGIALGLAALTKQSALALFPIAALAVVWNAQSGPRPRRTAFIWLLLLVVLTLLLAGWWYVHNALTYGDPLGFEPHQTPQTAWRPSPELILRQLGEALRGYWAVFGWGLIQVESIIYACIALFAVFGLSGALVYWFKARSGQHPNIEYQITTILGLGQLLNLIGLVLWLWRTSAPYGRLLYPTLGPLAVLLVMGWQHWLGQRYRHLFTWSVALTLGLFTCVVPWRYLRPAYPDPVVFAAVVDETTPVNVQFDLSKPGKTSRVGDVSLRGYRMIPETAKPGDQVELTLCWQATDSFDSNWMVFVQAAPQDPQQRVAGVDDYLGGSHYPSQVWQPGETICQVHEMGLPEHTPSPGLYWFTVGLYDAADYEQAPVTADGVLVPERFVRLGPLRVLGHDEPEPSQAVDYRFGSAVRLTGYDVHLDETEPSEVSYGDLVTVTFYWQAIATPTQDLVVFVHLLDADGHLVAQDDSPPRQGDFPLWAWQEGDRVQDQHTLVLPSPRKAGTYYLVVGLYRADDGTRVPVHDEMEQRVANDTAVFKLSDLFDTD